MAPTALTDDTLSASAFPGIPPFPSDVPTAPLVRLNFTALKTSEAEREAFFKASKELGFFYLDLRGDELGEELLRESEELFGVGEALFKEGAEVLSGYDFSKGERREGAKEGEAGEWKEGREPSYMGYKCIGKGVVDKEGNRDKNEFYNTPKDDLLHQSPNPFPHPKPITDNKPLMASYTRHSHALLTTLLTHLNTGLGLLPNTLEPYHAISLPSGDHIRLVHSPAPLQSTSPNPLPASEIPALGAHTDFGSLTLLFNRLGGLQVLLPPGIAPNNPSHPNTSTETGTATGTWAYVRPLPGHAIVNLGDALVKFSGGVLRSNIHRVATPPGKQASCSRLSLVYFMRPGDSVNLKRLQGGTIPPIPEGEVEEYVTAKKWIIDKAVGGTKLVSERGVGRETNRQLVELHRREGG